MNLPFLILKDEIVGLVLLVPSETIKKKKNMIHYDATNNVNLKIPDKDKHYESLVKRCADADQVADYREKRVPIYIVIYLTQQGTGAFKSIL